MPLSPLPQTAAISAYHREVVGRAVTAIEAVFGDTTVDPMVIDSSLVGLAERILEMRAAFSVHSGGKR